MSSVIELKKHVKDPQSSSQKTFNRLRKKVATLERELESYKQILDKSLCFYYEQIMPEEKALVAVLSEFVKSMYAYCKNAKQLSKRDRNNLKTLLLNKIDTIFSTVHADETDPEIKEIFKELEGVSFEDVVSDSMMCMKEEMQEMFRAQGQQIDLSKIEKDDKEPEVMRKLFEAMREAHQRMNDTATAKPKSKKQLQKEMKAKELKELQEKGLGAIYKQLARAFHPDLEMTHEKKAEKEVLMKRLTNAYENNDLHTLLALQNEWLRQSDTEENVQSEDQLKIFNSILKDQVEAVKESIEMTCLHPRYAPLQEYFPRGGYFGIPRLQIALRELQQEKAHFQSLMKEIKNGKAEKTVRAMLWELEIAYAN